MKRIATLTFLLCTTLSVSAWAESPTERQMHSFEWISQLYNVHEQSEDRTLAHPCQYPPSHPKHHHKHHHKHHDKHHHKHHHKGDKKHTEEQKQ